VPSSRENYEFETHTLPPENGLKAVNFLRIVRIAADADNRHERIKVMEMMKRAELSLFLFTITASGLALANCPGSMPEQLLNDCIVYEGAG